MKEQIVVIRDNESRAGTVLIAKGFGRNHDQVKRLITKYKEDFEKISPLKGDITKGKTKSFNEYFLTETQFVFLGMLFNNNLQVVKFKRRLAKEFDKCKKQLARALNQKYDLEWNQTRFVGKTFRILETGAIKEFIIYAKAQGGTLKGCDMYYSNFTRLVNTLLFICVGKFKNIRNVLTIEQLVIVSSAEQIIGKSLRDDMKAGLFYKKIYQNAKAKVALFAELSGQSEVLSEQILLEGC